MNTRSLFLFASILVLGSGCDTLSVQQSDGAARLAPDGSVDVLVNQGSSLTWRHVGPALDGLGTERGSVHGSFDGLVAPWILASADDSTLVANGPLDQVIEMSDAGSSTSFVADTWATTAFDAAGTPWMLVLHDDQSLDLVRGGAGGWTTIASTPQSCPLALPEALEIEASGQAVGLCGGQLVTASNGVLSLSTVPQELTAAPISAEGGTLDASGRAVFFVVLANGWVMRVDDTGAVTQLPLQLDMGMYVSFAVGSDHALAATVCPGGDCAAGARTIVIADRGAGFARELVALMPADDDGTVTSVDASGDVVLTGSIDLVAHRRAADGTWSTTALGRIGVPSKEVQQLELFP